MPPGGAIHADDSPRAMTPLINHRLATGAADIPAAGYRGSPRFLLAIQAYAGLARRVAYGELLIGLMLSAGAGLAALFGGLINWTYILAGTASPNPLLFVMAVALILAWKVSGTIGADFSGCAGSARPGERRRRKPSLH